MSVVIAVKQGGRIWFGADTQATRGGDRYNQLSPNDFKIMKFDNGVLISATGETVTAQTFIAHPEWFNMGKKKSLTKEYIVTEIIPKIYETLEAEGLLEKDDKGTPPIMGCTVLLAYKDQLFEICRDLQVIKYEDYQASGSGANAVNYGLSRIDKSKDINEQLLRLLKISAKLDSNVSAPFVFINTQDLKFTVKEG